jgi:hypothetical protein
MNQFKIRLNHLNAPTTLQMKEKLAYSLSDLTYQKNCAKINQKM